MNDDQERHQPLRFRLVNIGAGLLILGLAAWIGYKVFVDPPANLNQNGFLPWFDTRMLSGIFMGCMVAAAVLIACTPTHLSRYKTPGELHQDRRQSGKIFGQTKLPWWIAGPLLLLIFGVFAALLWAGMWE